MPKTRKLKPKPENRDLKIETRDSNPRTRDSRPETQNPKPETQTCGKESSSQSDTRNTNHETRNLNPCTRDLKPEIQTAKERHPLPRTRHPRPEPSAKDFFSRPHPRNTKHETRNLKREKPITRPRTRNSRPKRNAACKTVLKVSNATALERRRENSNGSQIILMTIDWKARPGRDYLVSAMFSGGVFWQQCQWT